MASYPTPDVYYNGEFKSVFNVADFISSAASATLADLRDYASLKTSNLFTFTQYFSNIMFSGSLNGIPFDVFVYISDLSSPIQAQITALTDSLNSQITALNVSFNSQITNLQALLDLSIINIQATMSEQYNTLSTAIDNIKLTADYAALENVSITITTLQTAIELQIENVYNTINDLRSSLTSEIQQKGVEVINIFTKRLTNWLYDESTNTQGITENTAFSNSIGSLRTNTEKLYSQLIKAITLKCDNIIGISVKCDSFSAKNVANVFLFNSGFMFPLLAKTYRTLPPLNFTQTTYLTVGSRCEVILINKGVIVKTILNMTDDYLYLQEYFGELTEIKIKDLS